MRNSQVGQVNDRSEAGIRCSITVQNYFLICSRGMLRETYHIVNAMRRAGNQGVIPRWKDSVARWAEMNSDSADAAAILAWLPFWHVRPFYTAEELSPMWPALAI